MRVTVSRRLFLLSLITLCSYLAGFAKIAHPFSQRKVVRQSGPLVSKLNGLFTHPDSAAIVGEEYLRGMPKEADSDLLIDWIFSHHSEGRNYLCRSTLVDLKRFLRRQQSEDFENNRLLHVRGWILSETEVRLCALTALASR